MSSAHALPWRHRLRQRHPEHRPVVDVVVVGVLERGRPGQVHATHGADRGEVDAPPAAVCVTAAPGPLARLAEEGALRVPEGVQVEVEPELVDGVRGGVSPDDALLSKKALRLGVQPDVDVVVDDRGSPLGQGVGPERRGTGTRGRRQESAEVSRPGDHGGEQLSSREAISSSRALRARRNISRCAFACADSRRRWTSARDSSRRRRCAGDRLPATPSGSRRLLLLVRHGLALEASRHAPLPGAAPGGVGSAGAESTGVARRS